MGWLVDLVPPAIALALAVGALWAAISAGAVPPPFRIFPRILIAAILGSLAGQWLGEDLKVKDLLLGDVHVVSVSVGAVLVSSVVRRLST